MKIESKINFSSSSILQRFLYKWVFFRESIEMADYILHVDRLRGRWVILQYRKAKCHSRVQEGIMSYQTIGRHHIILQFRSHLVILNNYRKALCHTRLQGGIISYQSLRMHHIILEFRSHHVILNNYRKALCYTRVQGGNIIIILL